MTVFLDGMTDLFKNGASWIIDQAKWVIIAALVVIGIRAWINSNMMQVFGSIFIGAILFMFAIGGNSFMQNLSEALKKILTGSG
jgi:hypothetical protein